MKSGYLAVLAVGMLAAGAAFGRGEGWVPAPSPVPPVETLTNVSRYIEWKWRTDVTDPATGIGNERAKTEMMRIAKELEPREPWCVVKARCFEWMCMNLSIDTPALDWFPAFACWNRHDRPMRGVVGRRNAEIEAKHYPETVKRIQKGNAEARWSVWKDFDHIVPDWDTIMRLGFAGMEARLKRHWRDEAYYRAEQIAIDGIYKLLDRLAVQGEKNLKKAKGADRARLEKQIASLKRLRTGAPQTALDAMQFIYLYFVLSEHFEAVQARSLSVIDKTLWPFYKADLAAGRTTEAEFREQFRSFLWQWGSIDNYWGQPVTMGGTKADGTTEYNPLSYVILEVMDECALPTPKFHLKVAENTPDDFLKKALDCARRHRPISFIGEKPTRRVLEHLGYSPDEARQFLTKGCYEFCTPKDGNGLGGGHPNLPKVLELMLADAAAGKFAAESFEEFFGEYLRRMRATLAEVCELFAVFERHMDDVNPALVASAAGEWSVKWGKCAMATGTRNGNRTSILLSGFGTAVDGLTAVKEIVYEKKEMGLKELGQLMAANWEGNGALRLRMARSKRKWGNNDVGTKEIAARISKAASETVNFLPNTRGGRFMLSGHNARQFIEQGRRTGATPDGRKRGDEISKNLSPTMGVDTEGVTALVNTLAALDSRDFPGDFPLDVMMLPYTVAGNAGIEAMKAIMFQYFDNGGLMMQFNVFDSEELKDAQRNPEKYGNLQVRVCGWNVRWNDLPKREQDAYILRAENLMK